MAKRLLTRDVELWKPPVGRFDRASVRPEWDWFWADIAAVYPFDEGGGGRTRNLARNPTSGDLTWTVADGPWQPTPAGRGVFLDNSASGTDSIFTLDSPDPGIWHDLFTQATHIVVCTLDTNSGGGPYVLIEEGGSFTGLELHYRTSPETLHYYVEIENIDVELDSTSTFSPDPSRILVVAGRYDNGAMSLWINGIEEATGTADQASFEAHSDEPGLGQKNGSSGPSGKEWGGKILAVYRSTKALTDDQMAQVGHDPFGPLRVRERRVYVRAPAAGGITGTLAETQDDQTLAATGAVEVSGTVAETQDAQTLAASGEAGVDGTLAVTQADNTLAATGEAGVDGSLAETQDAQTLAASGEAGVDGTLAETQDDQTLAASGTVTSGAVTGSLAETQDDQTLAASGESAVTGTLAVTQDAQTSSATGAVEVSGSLAETQDAQTLDASGALVYEGSVNTSQASQTLTASGTLIYEGSLATTQNDQTLSASGTSAAGTVTGTLSETQGNQTLTASGTSTADIQHGRWFDHYAAVGAGREGSGVYVSAREASEAAPSNLEGGNA